MAQLVKSNGSEKEYHYHYGLIRYDYIEGNKIINVIHEATNEEMNFHPLVGLDGWLRVCSEDVEINSCIEEGVEGDCFYYLKIHEMVIFPPPIK